MKCKRDMGTIATMVDVYREENGRVDLRDQRLMAKLIDIGTYPLANIFAERKIVISNGMALDPLGTPYQIRYNDGIVTLWSWGKNGIDEDGGGDDIKIRVRQAD